MRPIRSATCAGAIARYCAATGQTIDPRVIDYHTVRFGWVNPLSLLPLCEDPPVEIDYVQYKAWYVLCSRWSLDVLGRLVGARLDPVELPPSTPSIRAPAHRLMVRGLDPTSDSGSAYERSRLQRVAVYLERADRYGPALDAASLDELAAVLGQRPLSRRDADAELERLVLDAPPERDAELVRLFHRQLQREEFLLEPVLGYLPRLDLAAYRLVHHGHAYSRVASGARREVVRTALQPMTQAGRSKPGAARPRP